MRASIQISDARCAFFFCSAPRSPSIFCVTLGEFRSLSGSLRLSVYSGVDNPYPSCFGKWREDQWCRLTDVRRVPWTARRSNQSILKEISSEYSLEGLMLKLNCNTLATWCEERTHWKRPWCWERLKTGGEGDHRGWDAWMASPTQWTWVWVNSRSWRWMAMPGVLQSMGSQRVRHDQATELNWTDSF